MQGRVPGPSERSAFIESSWSAHGRLSAFGRARGCVRVCKSDSPAAARAQWTRKVKVHVNKHIVALVGMVLFCGGRAAAQAVQLDAKLPGYKTVQGVSGSISSKGSDTM